MEPIAPYGCVQCSLTRRSVHLGSSELSVIVDTWPEIALCAEVAPPATNGVRGSLGTIPRKRRTRIGSAPARGCETQLRVRKRGCGNHRVVGCHSFSRSDKSRWLPRAGHALFARRVPRLRGCPGDREPCPQRWRSQSPIFHHAGRGGSGDGPSQSDIARRFSGKHSSLRRGCGRHVRPPGIPLSSWP